MRSGSGWPAVYIRSDSPLLGNVLGVQAALPDVLGQPAGGLDNLLPAAVIDGDIQNHPVFMGGGSLRLLDEPADVRRERLPVADKAGAGCFRS